MIVGGRRSSLLGVAAAFAVATLAGAAQASPSAKLVYARSADTETCPDEAEFRKLVAARVGYDPFFPFAKWSVVTRVDRASTGYRARMEILNESAAVVGEKTFSSSKDDCEELVRTLALAVSLAIDITEPPKAPEPEPEPAVSAPTEVTAPPPAPPASVDRDAPRTILASPTTDVEASAFARSALGLGPAASLGLGLGVALVRGPWSMGIEGRFDSSFARDLDASGRLQGTLLGGTLVPCRAVARLRLCAFATVGRLSIDAIDIENPGRDVALLLAFGGRASLKLFTTGPLAFRVVADGGLAPLRHRVVVGTTEVYETSIITGSLGLSSSLGL